MNANHKEIDFELKRLKNRVLELEGDLETKDLTKNAYKKSYEAEMEKVKVLQRALKDLDPDFIPDSGMSYREKAEKAIKLMDESDEKYKKLMEKFLFVQKIIKSAIFEEEKDK